MTRHLTPEHWRGWHSGEFPSASWRRRDDGLEARPDGPRVDLVSHQRYRDFRFSFEFSLPPAGNSGVLYRVDEDADLSWHSGPEMQLLDDALHPDGREPSTRNGALYALQAPARPTPVEPGRFLQGQVVVRGRRLEHWLDGHCVVSVDLADEALQRRIAASKFGAFPHFARAAEGHLVLQHHGDAVRFRRLAVEPLV